MAFQGIVRVTALSVLVSALLSAAAQSTESAAERVRTQADASTLPNAPSAMIVGNSSRMNISDLMDQVSQNQQAPLQQQDQQTTPEKADSAPSLDDLGLDPNQTKPDADAQARLDRRTHDLKVHQALGIITLAPLAAACISSAAAPPDPRNGRGNTIGRDIHVSLGSLSVAMYGATAYYAIKAPRIPGEGPAKGGIKLHKYLIYIHAPGMILTPILGAMAFNQAADGEKVHGIASAHSAVAWTTVASYSAAILAVSWPIYLSWSK